MLIFQVRPWQIDEKSVKVFYQNAKMGFVDYLARIEKISFRPDNHAKILVNERTGTIVATEEVTIAPCAISIGGLTISVNSNVAVKSSLIIGARWSDISHTNPGCRSHRRKYRISSLGLK